MTPQAFPGDSVRATPRLSLDRIRDAATAIDPVFRDTPQYVCEPLAEALGCRLLLKVETANPVRCFKGRGADTFVRARGGRDPIVCASAGNFGQAMAYACRARGIPLTVFAAENANTRKIARIRGLGADVRLEGIDFDDAKQLARAFGGASFVEDGREPAISEGAGTIAVELLASGEPLYAVLVPLGNGALVNGVGRWLKAFSPQTRVIAVTSAGAPAMAESWRAGAVVTRARVNTIADGIAVRLPVPEALADMRDAVDEVTSVSDEDLVLAMGLVGEHAGLVAEAAAVAGIAALLASPGNFAGRTVATILTGSNVPFEGDSRD